MNTERIVSAKGELRKLTRPANDSNNYEFKKNLAERRLSLNVM